MFGLGHWEILIVLVVLLVVFGASRLPGLGRGLGEGLRGFKEALRGDDKDSKDKRDIASTDKNDGSKDA